VEVDVPEAREGAVAVGAPCEIVLDAFPNARHRGQVAMVDPRLNRAKATALVKVKFLEEVPALAGRNGGARGVFARRPGRPGKRRKPMMDIQTENANGVSRRNRLRKNQETYAVPRMNHVSSSGP